MIRLEALTRGKHGKHEVRTSVDVFCARRAVRVRALEVGFGRVAAEELVLAASELCTNILKYGRHGWLGIDEIESRVRGRGILLEARDFGPPFASFTTALSDGHDDRGPLDPDARRAHDGLGVGLGTVRRLTDAVEHRPLDDGKSVYAVRFVAPERARGTGPP